MITNDTIIKAAKAAGLELDYEPHDGITKDELISRVIACVDPWPSDGIHKLKEQL